MLQQFPGSCARARHTLMRCRIALCRAFSAQQLVSHPSSIEGAPACDDDSEHYVLGSPRPSFISLSARLPFSEWRQTRINGLLWMEPHPTAVEGSGERPISPSQNKMNTTKIKQPFLTSFCNHGRQGGPTGVQHFIHRHGRL